MGRDHRCLAVEAAPAPDAPGALAPVDAAEEKAQGDGPPPSVGTGEDSQAFPAPSPHSLLGMGGRACPHSGGV